MARPSKNAAIDYTLAHDLTAGLLERAACPDGVPFVLLKDTDKKGLRLRITKAGGKHWQFETRVKGKLFTRALGEWPTVAIGEARAKAHEYRGHTEAGIDPRNVEFVEKLATEKAEADRLAAEVAAAEAAAFMAEADKQAALTMGEAWQAYIAERRPHWGERHYLDHIAMTRAGGLPAARGTKGNGLTVAGPLHSFTALPSR